MLSIYFYIIILFFIIGITPKQVFEEFDTNGKQTKDQAEAALEEALGEIRFQAVENKNRENGISLLESSIENLEKYNLNTTLLPSENQQITSAPSIVLINPPIELPKSVPIANFIVHPNEQKQQRSQQKYQKFEFMPHFDREIYEFMVPEEPPIKADALVAVLTFFGHLNAQPPQFELKGEKLGWFTVGEVASTQNFAQIKVEVLPMRNYSHLEMEPKEEKEEKELITNTTIGTTTKDVLEVKKKENGEVIEEKENLDRMPKNKNSEKMEGNGTDIEIIEGINEEELKNSSFLVERREEEIKNNFEEEKVNEKKNVTINVENIIKEELINLNEETNNLTEEILINNLIIKNNSLFNEENKTKEENNLIKLIPRNLNILINKKLINKGNVNILYSKLPNLINEPIDNFILEYKLNEEEENFNLTNKLLHIWITTTSPTDSLPKILDIRPHYLAPGDLAELWLLNPTKILKEYFHLFPLNFKIFGQKVDEKGKEFIDNKPFLIFDGNLELNGEPEKAPKFEKNDYNFNLNENELDGYEIGKLKIFGEEESSTNSTTQNPLIYSLFGQGSNYFNIDNNGLLTLKCPSSSLINKNNLTKTLTCLDLESSSSLIPTTFYLVFTAKYLNSLGPSSSPISLIINIKDINDNKPIIKLIDDENNKEILIKNGQIMEGGPKTMAILDNDR
ncbi:unnamed protein product [Meloidogyne enterolobii]|uniref:Uncharacterized protein n=1 Tax=Meloidogyne enterolobii TaxID=390850 RepID=A0ACB0Y3X5_MELEN